MNKSGIKNAFYNLAPVLDILLLLFSSTIPYVNAGNLEFNPSDQKNVSSPKNVVVLQFAVGETAVLDCGYFTDEIPEENTISWLDSKMKEIKVDKRISVTTNNRTDYPKNETYSVLTLKVTNLTLEDNQTYVCTTGNREVKRITIDMKKKDTWYGFEGPGMSGWTTGDESSIAWHRHQASESVIQERTKGPKYDHTYSLLNLSTGHFIDIDVEHQNITTKSEATIISPQYSKTTSQSCLHFYYVLDGDGIGELEVLLKINSVNSSLIPALKDQTKIWKHMQKTIEIQNKEFKIMFKATVCPQKTCSKGVVAVDDVAITNGACEHNEPPTVVPNPIVQTTSKPTSKITTTTSSASTVSTSTVSTSTTAVTTSTNTIKARNVTSTTTQRSSTKISKRPTITTARSPTTTKSAIQTTKKESTTTTSKKPTPTAIFTVTSSNPQTSSSTTEVHSNLTSPSEKSPANHGVSRAARIGRGVVAGIVLIVLLGVVIFAVLIYKGRKRRLRKSKYLNFGSASYSREHLPTNEFHLESPLTMSSMGYTVLA